MCSAPRTSSRRSPEDQRPDDVGLPDFGFEEVVVKLATRPEKRVGTDAMWDHAEDILKKVLEQDGRRIRRTHQGRHQ
jgi:threonyl-tRNA synthetase